MGRFFSNIQIKNECTGRLQFMASLNKSMEKRVLIPATEEDSSESYSISFSEDDRWITLCSPDYESNVQKLNDDIQTIATGMKTCCIKTTVVDSDFSILEMYNGTNSRDDFVIVGDGSGYGFEDKSEYSGIQKYWEPLLADTATWNKLSEIWNKQYTFTEEALSEMAPLLGMDSENITSDYDDLSSRTDKNVMELHFKKSQKTMSLNTAFKKVFGEALEPLGFKKIKGKQPYFVRVVEGGEIIHVITCMNSSCYEYGKKAFNIWGGVATVYRKK